MFRLFKHVASATALLSVILALPPSGSARAETVPTPISIPIEFVETIQQDAAWLDAELKARNLPGEWRIEGDRLVTSDLEVAKYVHRIEAFTQLDPGDVYAYFILPLTDASGATGTCVTQFPRNILPDLATMDFRKERYEVPDLAAAEVQECLVKGPSGQPFESMGREEFWKTYFLPSGDLDVTRHEALDGNPDFINKAYELGYFPIEADDPGILRIR